MKLALRNEPSPLEGGMVVKGHEIEHAMLDHGSAELRFSALCPDGTPVTLVTSRHRPVDRRARARFRTLARLRARLQHPAAIRVRAVSQYAQRPVVITDPYPERTLGDLLEEEAPLAPERVVEMLAPVAEALDLAHSVGLVHEALGADSLLLTARDTLQLDTFGLLIVERRNLEERPWGLAGVGDVRYRSPEQMRGGPLGPEGNVYSLTALIVHALTGDPPYRGDRSVVVYSHLVDTPPAVSERVPELGTDIDEVVRRGMARDPGERPGSATELLRGAADALGVQRARWAAPPAPRPRPAVPAAARREPAVEPRVSRREPPAEPRLPGMSRREPPAEPRLPGMSRRNPPAEPRVPRVSRRAIAAVATAIACGALAALAFTPFGGDVPRASPPPAAAAAWKQLGPRRAELRDRLAAARTPQDQASAAAALGELYDGAARTGYPRELAGAAGRAAAAYAGLVEAAHGNDRPAYAKAGRAVHEAERRLALAAARYREASRAS
jgi:serine/threonine protein kinase